MGLAQGRPNYQSKARHRAPGFSFSLGRPHSDCIAYKLDFVNAQRYMTSVLASVIMSVLWPQCGDHCGGMLLLLMLFVRLQLSLQAVCVDLLV